MQAAGSASGKKKKKDKPLPDFVLRGHAASVVSLAWAPDGRTLASGGLDGALMLWSLATRRCALKFGGTHEGRGVNTVSFDAHHTERLWSQGRDGWIRHWDVETQQCISAHDVGCHGFVGLSIAYASSACYGALPNPNDMQGVLLLGMDTREKHVQVIHQFASEPSYGMCMKLACTVRNNVPQVYCGYESGNVVTYSEADGRHVFPAPVEKKFPLTAIGIHTGSGLGCVGGAEQALFPFHSSDSTRLEYPDVTLSIPGRGLNDIAFRHDAKVYATAGWDGKVRLFATKRGRERIVCVCEFHSESINSVAFQPDSKVFAAASKDARISLWNVC